MLDRSFKASIFLAFQFPTKLSGRSIIPVSSRVHSDRACWLNLQEGWWLLFRCDTPAGQSFANPKQIAQSPGFEDAYVRIVGASFVTLFKEPGTIRCTGTDQHWWLRKCLHQAWSPSHPPVPQSGQGW